MLDLVNIYKYVIRLRAYNSCDDYYYFSEGIAVNRTLVDISSLLLVLSLSSQSLSIELVSIGIVGYCMPSMVTMGGKELPISTGAVMISM